MQGTKAGADPAFTMSWDWSRDTEISPQQDLPWVVSCVMKLLLLWLPVLVPRTGPGVSVDRPDRRLSVSWSL